MRGVNKVLVIGNLGSDPDVKYTQGGTAITTLSIATTESWKDKTSGEQQERTEWHRVKLFGRLAEIAGEYLKKGRQVYIEGSLRTEKYTDKSGVEKYSTDIIASEMQMLGGNDGGGQRQGNSEGSGQRQGSQSQGGGGGYGGGSRAPQGNGQGSRAPSGNGGNRGGGGGGGGRQPEYEGAGYGGGGGRHSYGNGADDVPFAAVPMRLTY